MDSINSSEKYSESDVKELIENYKRKGWVFSFIGANIDVENTARSLNIGNYMEFEQTDEGASQMFEKQSRSRENFGRCLAMAVMNNKRKEFLKSMNESLFDLEDENIPF